jgi:hypothetical protein
MLGINSIMFYALVIVVLISLFYVIYHKNKVVKGTGLIALAVAVQIMFRGAVIDIVINKHSIRLDEVIFITCILIQVIGIVMLMSSHHKTRPPT